MKKRVVFLSLLLAALFLLSAFGCGQTQQSQVQRVKLSDSEGVPDAVATNFIVGVMNQSFDGYAYVSHQTKHDVYSEAQDGYLYIADYADMDVRCEKNGEPYSISMNAIFVKNPETNGWGFSSMSFSMPEKLDGGESDNITVETQSGAPASYPTVPDQPTVTPPTKKEDPTPTPTPSPEPTPTPTPSPTPTPATFYFGGVQIETGTTEILGKDGVNGDSKGHFTHITREEVETLVTLCPNLRTLDLDYVWFDTYEPLSKLTKLNYLELKSCGTDKGGRRMTDIDWIADLKNLTHLNLCHNAIDDISALKNLKNLEWLNLGDNRLNNADLEDLTDLDALDTLYLYTNSITDVSALSSMQSLMLINVGNNKKLKTVKPLTSLKNLTDLKIFNTGVNDLSYFPKFKKLKTVDLAGCPLSFSDYYDYLPQCPKLKTFIVAKNDTEGILAGDAILNDGYNLDYQIK